MSNCDCLSYCGDDPDIHRGTASPCTHYVSMMQRKRLIDAAPRLLCLLKRAEDFIAGFEGDPLQDGIDELLSEIREAVSAAEA